MTMIPALRRTATGHPLRVVFAAAAGLLVFLQLYAGSSNVVAPADVAKEVADLIVDSSTQPQYFETIGIRGFANSRVPDGPKCAQLQLPGKLAVSKSIDVDDDLYQVAKSIQHPMIDYYGQPEDQNFTTTVDKTWGRMAGASAWLEKYQVYMTVSRVYYYDKGVRHWPVLSLIRAQIHDEAWNHLDGYELEWMGDTITFPRILDVPVPYKAGGGFYGPEDPRIIIEQGILDAEPVVIFNMVENTETTVRSMHTFRPFSNFTTKLYIEHQDTPLTEKNWSPFFVSLSGNETSVGRYPNRYLHFLYDYHPLRILKCHLLNGACSWAYQQEIPGEYAAKHRFKDTPDVMRGGTNLIQVDVEDRPGLTSFVGFPRTHCEEGCGLEAMYRPELMVLTTNNTHFWIDYLSEPLSFGTSVLTKGQLEDACDTGRIMLANSITRFDEKDSLGRHTDTMTVSFTVADATVQIATVKGVRALVQSLPQFNSTIWKNTDIQWNLNVTHDVLLCSIQSATEFSYENTTPAQLEEVRRKKEADRVKQKEEEEKKKLEELAAAAKEQGLKEKQKAIEAATKAKMQNMTEESGLKEIRRRHLHLHFHGSGAAGK